MKENQKILIVEDFVSIRKREIEILRGLGYRRIIEAGNGREAILKLAQVRDIDLVISDWNMPEMSGIELLAAIRSHPQAEFHAVKFIMVTAQAEQALVDQAKAAGADGFISKPFSAEELNAIIEELFSDHAALTKTTPKGVVPPVKKQPLKVAHIQITDHLILGGLDYLLRTGAQQSRYFDLNPVCMPSWNIVQQAIAQGTVDAAFVLAPIAMNLFSAHTPIKLVLFAHKNGSVCIQNQAGAQEESLPDYFKNKKFFLPHLLSVQHILADMFLKALGLKLGPSGKPEAEVFYEVVPPVQMPELLYENQDAGGFMVAEPIGALCSEAGIGKLMFHSGALWENHPCCVVVMRQDFIDSHPDAAHEFVALLVKSGKFIAAEPDTAAMIAVNFLDPDKRLGLTIPMLEKVLKSPHGLKTDDLFPILEDLERMQNYMAEKMGIGDIIDLEQFVDFRFAETVYQGRPDSLQVSVIKEPAGIVADILNRHRPGAQSAAVPEPSIAQDNRRKQGALFEVVKDKGVIRFRFASEMRLVDQVVREVRAYFSDLGFHHFSEIRLVIRELLINAIEHGNRLNPDLSVNCDITHIQGAMFKIKIEDQGGGFDYDGLNKSLSDDPDRIRERGYALLYAFCEKVVFNQQGNQITVFIRAPTETKFEITEKNEWLIIHPSGDITATVADSFRSLIKNLLDAGHVRFSFNFDQVKDIDSVSLSVFIVLHKLLKDRDYELEITNIGGELINLFRMTHLDKIYRISSVTAHGEGQ